MARNSASRLTISPISYMGLVINSKVHSEATKFPSNVTSNCEFGMIGDHILVSSYPSTIIDTEKLSK